ncbi:MAG: carboxypeptidase M32 [Chloroflexi bacterium]|nr:carboxypeptidase M32 [Chloroflexota bacterium]MBU1747460.1 carboxypeptidase M32 [Chloroflexota bacterium]
MKAKLQALKTRLLEIDDLNAAASLLQWDQATYMPPGGAVARGRQQSTLSRLAHEKLTDPAIGGLLDDLQAYEESLPYDSPEASLIRVTRRKYERAAQVPPSFMAELNEHAAVTYQAWTRARPADDFAAVQPLLEKTLVLSRRLAGFFPGYEHIADPLIDYADYGMTVSMLRALFADLREQLVPIVQAVTAQPPTDDSCLRQHFAAPQQIAFGLDVIQRLGYDLDRGRQDQSPHPFSTHFSLGDVRITTRVNEGYLGSALFGTMHEAGHAMYDQGICPDFEGTPLADGPSAGVHESQSRLWENLVGRSRGFWRFFYPRLQAAFPEQLSGVSEDAFYAAINQVERSLIRVAADELTYNLHVMIRFDLELALLEGNLAVRDLPGVWRERYLADLGIAPPNDRDGVMQDMHWYSWVIGGMFQGYTLGNVMGAQFFDAALRAHPEIPAEMEQGEFGTLHRWLKDHIYQHGAKYTATELVERITGQSLSVEPYIRYLKEKYSALYGVTSSPP